MSSTMLVNPLITGYMENLGASAGLMGMTGGLLNFCSLLSRPITGNIVDRIQKSYISLTGAICIFLAGIGYCIARVPALIVIFRILNGIGFSLCSISLSTWLTSLLPPDKIGTGMGFYGMMNALGMAVAPAIGTAVYQRSGYLPALRISIFLSAFCMVSVFLVQDKGVPLRNRADIPRKLSVADIRILPVALIIMLFSLPYCAIQSFILRYTEALELPVHVSFFFPVYAGCLLILRFLFKNQFNSRPFRAFFFPAVASLIFCLLCLFLMRNDFLMLCAAVFLSCSYGIMCTVCQSKAITMASEECRGLANSTYYIGFDLGMALGPMIGGLLYGHVRLSLFFPSLMICAIALLILYSLFFKQLR